MTPRLVEKDYDIKTRGAEILIGTTITDVYVAKTEPECEGGFTLEFTMKDGKKGLFILGYTELGEWVEDAGYNWRGEWIRTYCGGSYEKQWSDEVYDAVKKLEQQHDCMPRQDCVEACKVGIEEGAKCIID